MKYELTVTLRPYMYTLTATEQYNATAVLLEDTIAKVIKQRKYSIVAELTGENNIHYHCLLELKNHSQRDQLLNQFRSKDRNKIFGRKTCNPVTYEESYMRYMTKDTNLTWGIIGQCPVLIDYYAVLDHKQRINGFVVDEPEYKVTPPAS